MLDMGTGSGLLAEALIHAGAEFVYATDSSRIAVSNARLNLEQHYPSDHCVVQYSNLFDTLSDILDNEELDTIVWNIPFFPGRAPTGDTIAASMLMPPELLAQFLTEARAYLRPDGVIIITSHSRGGPLMDPCRVGAKLGYQHERTYAQETRTGVQTGMLYVNELRMK